MRASRKQLETTAEHDIGIGGRVKAARLHRGWTREALAFHSGISWSAIAQVESGRRRNLRPNTLSALAHGLGVTIDYLVSGAVPAPMLEHRACFYGTDAEFVAIAAPFLTEAVERAEAALVVTSARNITALKRRLGSQADAIGFAEHTKWYRTPVAALTAYQAFMDLRLQAGAPWIRILGEPVRAGWSASETRLWCRYESLLNLAFAATPATMLCPYDRRTVDDELLGHAHATHPYTLDGDLLSPSATYAEPDTFLLMP
jgi:transcriptional regulator with XRE-family HTH domain